MLPETLDHPPLPPLTWGHYSWVGEVVLPSWAGFQARYRDDEGGGSRQVSDGSARLLIAPLDAKARTPPTTEQVAAFRYLLSNEAAVAEAVVAALVAYCPESYDDGEDVLLDVHEPDDLRPLVALSTVRVLDVFHAGEACVGFAFECVWDDEHAAGVMTLTRRASGSSSSASGTTSTGQA